jgi:hypothetical protein
MKKTAMAFDERKEPRSYKKFQITENDLPLIRLLEPEHQEMLRASGSYAQIAAQLKLPLGTVRSRLHRARAALAALRQEFLGNP